MPVNSKQESRRLVHTRQFLSRGYERDNGLWDIETILTDTKPFEVALIERPVIPAEEPIHGITLILTVDRTLIIQAASLMFSHSPYSVCGNIAKSYQQLVGMRIEPGFLQAAKSLFKGTKGCTHSTEMIGIAASTAFQTLWNQMNTEQDFDTSKELPKFAVGGCHALDVQGSIVRQYARNSHSPG